MTRLIDLIFYVAYLRIKKNESSHTPSSVIANITLIGMGVHGLLFFNGLLSLIGVLLDIKLFKIFFVGIICGIPVIFFNAVITIVASYFYYVRSGRYLNYPNLYPEINNKNLDEYDQKYLLIPAVISIVVLLAGLILPGVILRGI